MLKATIGEANAAHASRFHSAKDPETNPFRRKPMLDPIQKPLRVVVFEDVVEVLDIYHERLGKLKGIELVKVPPVESFEVAIDIFRKEQPDVVITDLSLTSSHTEGFEILRTLKKHFPDTCIILTTSIYSPKNHDELNEHIRLARFDAVFHKADLDHLVAYLEGKAGILH